MSAAVDWIGFGRAPRLPTELDRMAKDWTKADERSEVLRRAVPEQRTRGVLIANANHDLAMVTGAGHAAAMDPWPRVLRLPMLDAGSQCASALGKRVLFVSDISLWLADTDRNWENIRVDFATAQNELERQSPALPYSNGAPRH
jgi:hypothetical protein